MAITEVTGVMKCKDADGNTYIVLPATTKENVEGLEEVDAHLLDKSNPHEVTTEQIGAAAEKHNHSVLDILDFPSIPTKLSELENDLDIATVDSMLDSDSTNPVQNKIITEEINSIKSTINEIETLLESI